DAVGAKQGVQQQRQALATALLQLQLELGGGVQVEEIQLVRRLGAGSFGTVYQGLWRNLEVAVKRVLFSHLASVSAHHSRRQALHEVAL
ncbi:serine/threonine protein kinase 5, partial [Haematococcus lacustris]